MSRPVYCHAVAHCGGSRVRRDAYGRYYTAVKLIAHDENPQCVDPQEVPPSGNASAAFVRDEIPEAVGS